MRPYVALDVCLVVTAYCFYSGYYGFRFPEKYTSNPWTRTRGLIANNVEGTAAFLS
jgi:hypothetical protein